MQYIGYGKVTNTHIELDRLVFFFFLLYQLCYYKTLLQLIFVGTFFLLTQEHLQVQKLPPKCFFLSSGCH